MALIVLVIPAVYAESYDELQERARLTINTNEGYFEALSSWASDNKDELGKDITFYVENMPPLKADFTISNVSLIPDENLNYILSFDTTVKLKSEVRYPTEFVMDGRSLTMIGVTEGGKEYFNAFGTSSCDSTGIEFNSESGDTGTFHSCFSMSGNDEVGNTGAGEVEGVGIYVNYYNTGLQPIGVINLADIENIEEETISIQQTSWFDSILNFFKSLFA